MVNVVVDTNVLMASLLKREGPNRSALRKVLDPATPLKLCLSSQILDEYSDVLHRYPIESRGLTPQADGLVSLMRRCGEEVIPKFIPAIVYPDEDDRAFLEAAVYVNGILLTNNLKDYPFLGVTVIGPQEFLDWCEEAGI